jgi:hypothetical protein
VSGTKVFKKKKNKSKIHTGVPREVDLHQGRPWVTTGFVLFRTIKNLDAKRVKFPGVKGTLLVHLGFGLLSL